MDSKSKIISYRGGMYLLLAILIIALIGGFITYHFSLLSHNRTINGIDEGIFFAIISFYHYFTIIIFIINFNIYKFSN